MIFTIEFPNNKYWWHLPSHVQYAIEDGTSYGKWLLKKCIIKEININD